MTELKVSVRLTSAEEAQLAGILKKKVSEIAVAFTPYAEAAVEEYFRMFLGQKVFTRGSDVREYRLFLLIRTAFGNQIPDEQSICALFQCTLSQSRALLRAVMSKYQYELRTAIEDTLQLTVRNVRADPNGAFLVTANNENIVAELNKVLASIDGAQDQVAKKTGKLATYELQPAAYQALCKQFGVTPVKPK